MVIRIDNLAITIAFSSFPFFIPPSLLAEIPFILLSSDEGFSCVSFLSSVLYICSPLLIFALSLSVDVPPPLHTHTHTHAHAHTQTYCILHDPPFLLSLHLFFSSSLLLPSIFSSPPSRTLSPQHGHADSSWEGINVSPVIISSSFSQYPVVVCLRSLRR